MSHGDQDRKRLRVSYRDGLKVYSASAWPGWRDIVTTLVGFIFIAVFLGVIVGVLYKITGVFDELTEYKWINTVLRFVVMGSFDLSFVAMLGFCLLWIPYFLLYQLSPKEFWLEDECLCHRVWLLGLIRRTRRISFDRVFKTKIGHSGMKMNNTASYRVFHLGILYKMRLPRLVYIIVVYWNERLTMWPLTLVNGIPTREEAEQVQLELLEAVTKPAPDHEA